VIQFGAILAICWEYRRKIGAVVTGLPANAGARRFATNVVIATIPAIVLALLFEKAIKSVLFSPVPVSVALIVGGVVILWAEARHRDRGVAPSVTSVDDLTYSDALKVGLAQCFALIPGTSRSGATIIGGMLFGLERRVATEFSFFLAIPVIFGATLYEMAKYWRTLSVHDVGLFLVGLVAAFVSAFVCVRWLLRYVATHDFTAFAWYRIGMPWRFAFRGCSWRGFLTAPEQQVPYAVPEPDAAPLEFRDRAVVRTRRVAVGGILKRGLCRQHLEHLLGVVLPVGREMDVAARLQAGDQQRDEFRLDQPALVMARLVPRVREVDVHAVQAVRRDHVLEHLDGVVLDDADIGEILLADQLEQRAHARLVHFDPEKIVGWPGAGDLRRGPAHAEADLQHARRTASENAFPVGQRGRIGHDEARAEVVERAALAGRDAAGARHEAADASAVQGGGVVCGGGIGRVVRGGGVAGVVLGIVNHR
jgi:undecaprenyl-diphosphatase